MSVCEGWGGGRDLYEVEGTLGCGVRDDSISLRGLMWWGRAWCHLLLFIVHTPWPGTLAWLPGLAVNAAA